MLTELGKRTDEHSENFNRKSENLKKNHSELKRVSELKNALEGTKSRPGDREEHSSALGGRVMGVTSKKSKEKEIFKNVQTHRSTLAFTLQGFQKEKRKEGAGSVFDGIMAENFPKLKKETNVQAQEA